MKILTNRLLAMILFIFLIVGLGFLTQRFGSLEWIVENEIRMRQFVQMHPWQGWFWGLAIYTTFSLVPGTAGKSVIFGWVFGFWQAVLMVDIGLTIAAMGGFCAGRFFIRETVQARFKNLIDRLDHRLEKDGAYYLIMLRLAHVPYSFVNYCAGATSVPLRTFAWTTAIGILPGTMIFVLVGTRIPTLAAIAEIGEHGGLWQLLDPWLLGMLVATVAFPLFTRWAFRKFRSDPTEPPDVEMADFDSLISWTAIDSTQDSAAMSPAAVNSTLGSAKGHSDATH